jgi:translation elongation factor EF-1alpha
MDQVVAVLDSNDEAVGEDRGGGGGVVQVGQVALVRLRPLKALVVEPHSAIGSLGRIVVHDGKVPLAIGKVVSVVRRLKGETASLVNPAHSTQCSDTSPPTITFQP